MNITKGKISSAQKIVVYGPEGIGKSTFASQFPDPLFIDTEGSTKKLDIARFDKPSSWTMLCSQVDYVIANPGVCKTLVIDTFDWAEQLCVEYICSRSGKKGIEDFGYGNGYVYEKEEIGRFLNKLEEVINRNINVVLTAHAQIRKFEQPDEMGAYDRWELKLGKKTSSQISPLIKEWADCVFFANYETITVTDDKTKKVKAQGGKRVMYTTHHVCWDAKNRDGLPERLPFEFSSIAHILNDVTAAPVSAPVNVPEKQPEKKPEAHIPESVEYKEIPDDFDENEEIQPFERNVENTENCVNSPNDPNIPKPLADLMAANGVTEDMICAVVAQEGYFPADTKISNYPEDFVMGVLVGAWDKVYAAIKKMNEIPF